MKNLLLLFFSLIISTAIYAQNEFITTWRTTSANESITIPTTGGGYNYTVDWGDGSSLTTGATGDTSHSYAVAGDYMVKISGAFPRIYFFGSFIANPTNLNKIININQWGNIVWSSMEYAFFKCTNLNYSAIDTPNLSNVTTMENMFDGASSFNGDLSNWDVSNVTTMQGMFSGASSFNGDLSTWDVSNVMDMTHMFSGASSFNRDLSTWDVSNVRSMYGMFYFASSLNGDISTWDVSNVTTMFTMFYGASLFNGDLSNWNVSNVTTMLSMFYGASSFNGDLSNWNVSNVANMTAMFYGASSFDQNLGSWDISRLTDAFSMLNNTNLSIANYDNTLVGWASQTVKPNVYIGVSGLKYCNSATERQSLITNHGWTFIGDSPAIDNNSVLVTITSSLMEDQSGSIHHYGINCDELIATIEQSGTNPTTGNVSAKVWKQASIPTHNGEPYVARHYEITPALDPSTSTGTVTLYFTQAEFDDYNNHSGSADDLPTNPSDALGIANLRITKYSGISNDGSGLPSTFSNGSINIDPLDANIVWNTNNNAWEVTFDVTGFSGFFLHSNSTVLPVELTNFQAKKQEKQVRLYWQTASETNNKGFQIEHSTDGKYFEKIGFVAGQGTISSPCNYEFLHHTPISGNNYYRLKQIDYDETFDYSNVEVVEMQGKENLASFYPNPSNGQINIRTSIRQGFIMINDINGKTVYNAEWQGGNIDITALPKGLYFISFIGEGETFVNKIFKE